MGFWEEEGGGGPRGQVLFLFRIQTKVFEKVKSRLPIRILKFFSLVLIQREDNIGNVICCRAAD